MKKFLIIFVICVVLGSLLSGCGKSDIDVEYNDTAITASNLEFDQVVSDALQKLESKTRQRRIEEIKLLAEELRKDTFSEQSLALFGKKRMVLISAEAILRGIAEGLVTWEELGFANNKEFELQTYVNDVLNNHMAETVDLRQTAADDIDSGDVGANMNIDPYYDRYFKYQIQNAIRVEATQWSHEKIQNDPAGFQLAVNKRLFNSFDPNVTVTITENKD